MARWNHHTIDGAWVVDHIHLNSGKGGVNLSSARETPTSGRESKYIQEHAGVKTYWKTNPKTHYPTLRELKGKWGKLGFYYGPVLPNHSASGTRTGYEILMPWWCPTLILVLLSSMLATPYILYFIRKRRANKRLNHISESVPSMSPEKG
jgi:hypothetical protein